MIARSYDEWQELSNQVDAWQEGYHVGHDDGYAAGKVAGLTHEKTCRACGYTRSEPLPETPASQEQGPVSEDSGVEDVPPETVISQGDNLGTLDNLHPSLRTPVLGLRVAPAYGL